MVESFEGQPHNGNDRNLRRAMNRLENITGRVVTEADVPNFSSCVFGNADPSLAGSLSLAAVVTKLDQCLAAAGGVPTGQQSRVLATGGIPVPPPAPTNVNPLIPTTPTVSTSMIPVDPRISASVVPDASFGFLGDVFGGIKRGFQGFLTGGPIGAIGGILGGGAPPAAPGVGTPPIIPTSFGSLQQPIFPGQSPQEALQRRFKGFQLGPLEIGSEEELLMSLAGAGLDAAQRGIGCPTGSRLNKSSYWRRGPDGSGVFIPKGTRCVSNRRINPANGRATRRAISRIKSAKRLSKDLSRISIRKKC